MSSIANQIPRRVLMTADTVGGVWTYAVELCRALQPFGVQIALATMGAPLREDQRDSIGALSHVEVFESGYKLEWMEDPWEDVSESGHWLLEIEKTFRPDIIHLNGYAHGALPFEAPALVVGHSCVFSWWSAVRGGAPGAAWARYREVVAEGLRCAGLVTAPTRHMLDALRHHYGAFQRGPVVYNGRASSDFRPGPKEPLALTAGRLWDEAKNVRLLDEAAVDLPWPVYVAGEERHPDGLGQARFDGLRGLGRLAPPELATWMGRAALYVLPAKYEPFGLTALEAALSGCALVLGDIPSLREVWEDAAVFVPPRDAAALRRVLQQLMTDEEGRCEMALKAEKRALAFTLERMATGYLNLYGSLLGETRSATPDREFIAEQQFA